MRCRIAGLLLAMALLPGTAIGGEPLGQRIDSAAAAIEPKVIAWRRDVHQNPELGYQEERTAALVAAHLRALGYDVRTGIARTGVVAVLKGGKPGPVVALRADMDALPVKEETGLPFASTVRATWRGAEVPVMHACGHDAHVAILMGVAEILAGLREELPGTVKLLFQPAEEGSPDGTPSGATLMVRAGAMEDPKPDAIFALHVVSGMPTGVIGLRPAGMLASSDLLRIEVIGRATHGSSPWAGVDPIVAASQVVLSLQTVVSRQTDLTQSPVVVTIGSIQGGNRSNIIPDKVVMEGTIRTHDAAVQARVHDRVREVAKAAAQTQGAEAQVSIFSGGYPVTYNDPPLTEWALTSLRRSTGEEKVRIIPPQMGSEDFSVFTRSAPGVYFFLGVTLPGDGGIFGRAAANHSGKFMVHEPALRTGVKALATLTVDFLERGK